MIEKENLKEILISFLKEININPKRTLKLIFNIGISIIGGLLMGWNYRLPTKVLIKEHLSLASSEWQKDLAIEYYKQTYTSLSTYYFYMNWQVVFISSFMLLFVLMFLNDQPFRQYLFDKFTFKNERNK